MQIRRAMLFCHSLSGIGISQALQLKTYEKSVKHTRQSRHIVKCICKMESPAAGGGAGFACVADNVYAVSYCAAHDIQLPQIKIRRGLRNKLGSVRGVKKCVCVGCEAWVVHYNTAAKTEAHVCVCVCVCACVCSFLAREHVPIVVVGQEVRARVWQRCRQRCVACFPFTNHMLSLCRTHNTYNTHTHFPCICAAL